MKQAAMICVLALAVVVAAAGCDPQGDEVRKGTNACHGSNTVCLDLDVFWNTQQCSGRTFVKETRLTYRWRQLDSQFAVRNISGKLGYVSLVGCTGRLGQGEVRTFSRALPAAGQWYQVAAPSAFKYHTSVSDYEVSGAWVKGDVVRGSHATRQGTLCIQQLWRPNGGNACQAI